MYAPTMESDEIDRLAKKIWDYHLLHQPLQKADCIFVLGSHDTRIAEWGAKLYLEGWAPLLVYSGGRGNLTRDWKEMEADVFARIAYQMGVPEEHVLVENQSSNTGENILFTRKLLAEKGITLKKLIVVQKPYMERRSYATMKKLWPEMEFVVSSPPISFEAYPNETVSREQLIIKSVGDFERIAAYPKKGFQIEQEIPADVRKAYEKLKAAGYTEHILE